MYEFLKLKDNEIGKECKFATYVKSNNIDAPDLHVIKEQIHYQDGSIKPNLRFIYNFERPYWVVKKAFRNYKQPKEWIDINKTNKFYTTQKDLIYNVARSLGMRGFRGGFSQLLENPYLFGLDISSTSIIKQSYLQYHDKVKSPYTVGVFDTETDVLHGTEQIMMATYVFQDICYTAIHKSFLKGYAFPEKAIEDKTIELLKKHATKITINESDNKQVKKEKEEILDILNNFKDKYKIITEIVDDEIDILINCFKVIHESKPDILAIWNMKFDIGKIIEACQRADYPIERLMSDPSIPDEYKHFEFKLGPSQKKKASGEITPIRPAAQWHTVETPASFYILDAMCVYRHTRMGEQEKKSYSLDAILNNEIQLGKLSIPELDQYEGLEWHVNMQKDHPIEYVVYNRFDCIGMILLENKIKDMSVILPQFSGSSDFSNFKSQPKRKIDELHWTVFKHKKVIGCTSKLIYDEEMDKDIMDRSGWIVALAPSLTTNDGLACIKENEHIHSKIYVHVGDLDVSASLNNSDF